MDALAELEDLEERHAVLAEQYADLVEAKNALDRIIGRINADSRRLFTETLEAIRANFQRMFRKVFGGGSVTSFWKTASTSWKPVLMSLLLRRENKP